MKAVSGVDERGQPRQGPYQQRFKNGNLACEGAFDQGRKTGLWTYYLANGAVKAVGSYQDDTMIGDWLWYRENGELMQTGSFSTAGEKHGQWRRYHPNGSLMDEVHFERGQKMGALTKYDESGVVRATNKLGHN